MDEIFLIPQAGQAGIWGLPEILRVVRNFIKAKTKRLTQKDWFYCKLSISYHDETEPDLWEFHTTVSVVISTQFEMIVMIMLVTVLVRRLNFTHPRAASGLQEVL